MVCLRTACERVSGSNIQELSDETGGGGICRQRMCDGRIKHTDENMVYAFVDGSYNSATQVYGYGGFLMDHGERYVLQGHGDDPEMASMRNVEVRYWARWRQ